MKDIEKLYGNKNLTPIEVALQIDENGMTTAKKLYRFLELNISNYAKWCRVNIVENVFATENVDFTEVVLEYETPTGGKVRTADYKLSANFAKKLCMTSKTEKGEQARNYFIKVEELLAQKVTQEREQKPHQQKVYSYTYNGIPVYTVKQLSEIYSCTRSTVSKHCKKLIPTVDYARLIGKPMKLFKSENENVSPCVAYMLIIFDSGLEKLDKILGSKGYITTSRDTDEYYANRSEEEFGQLVKERDCLLRHIWRFLRVFDTVSGATAGCGDIAERLAKTYQFSSETTGAYTKTENKIKEAGSFLLG